MLKPRKRITRKKLKEDKLVTFYFKAVDKLEKNINLILGVAAAIVVIVAGVAYYLYSSNKAEQLASVELAKAMRVYEIGDYQNAIAQLSTVTENYGGSRSGKLARFYLAHAFYQIKDYENAEKNFRRFLSGFSGEDHFLAAAKGGVAATLCQRGQYAKAAEIYREAAEKYESTLAPAFLLQAGMCYARDQATSAKARQMYELLVSKYPKSPEKDDALMLMNMMKK